MPQTSMSADPAVGLVGERAYPSRTDVVDSYQVGGSTAIPFGVFVCQSTTDALVTLPAQASDVTGIGIGFALRDDTKPFDATGYAVGAGLGVLRKGYIRVNTEGAVAKESAVYARYSANGGLTQLGAIRADADSSHAAAVPNARFMNTLSAAGQAIVEVW